MPSPTLIPPPPVPAKSTAPATPTSVAPKPFVPMAEVLKDPRYQALPGEKRNVVIDRWSEKARSHMEETGGWNMDTYANFKVATQQERERNLGIEEVSTPDEILGDLDEDMAVRAEKRDSVFAALDRVKKAREVLSAAEFKDFKAKFMGHRSSAVIPTKEAKAGLDTEMKKSGFTDDSHVDYLTEVMDMLDPAKKTNIKSAVIEGSLLVAPELYLRKADFLKAVKESTADPEEKAFKIAEFDGVHQKTVENYAKALSESSMTFRKYVRDQREKDPSISEAEMIWKFKDEDRGAWEKAALSFSRGYLGFVEGFGYMAAGAGKLAGVESLEKQGMKFLGDMNKTKQDLGEGIEALGGQGFGLKVLEGATSLTTTIASAAAGGIVTTGVKALAKNKIKGELAKKFLTSTQFARALTETSVLAGAGLQSAAPKLYEAYQARREALAATGLSGDELEERAQQEAWDAANTAGLATAAITAVMNRMGIFGGVENTILRTMNKVAKSTPARATFVAGVRDKAKELVASAGAAGRLAGSLAGSSLGEGFEEAMDAAAQGLLDKTTPNMTMNEFMGSIIESGQMGAAIGLLTEGPVKIGETILESSYDRARQNPQITQARQTAQNLRQTGHPELANAVDASATQATVDTVQGDVETTESEIAKLDAIDQQIAALADKENRTPEEHVQLTALRAEQDELTSALAPPDPNAPRRTPEEQLNIVTAHLATLDPAADPAQIRATAQSVVDANEGASTPKLTALATQQFYGLPAPAPTATPATPAPGAGTSTPAPGPTGTVPTSGSPGPATGTAPGGPATQGATPTVTPTGTTPTGPTPTGPTPTGPTPTGPTPTGPTPKPKAGKTPGPPATPTPISPNAMPKAKDGKPFTAPALVMSKRKNVDSMKGKGSGGQLSVHAKIFSEVADSHSELLDRAESLGIDVVVVNSKKEAQAYSKGKNTGRGVNLVHKGRNTVMIRAYNLELNETAESLSRTLEHEIIHGAHRIFLELNEDRSSDVLSLFDKKSPNYDKELNRIMEKEYPSFSSLESRFKMYETVRALVEGRLKGYSSTGSHSNSFLKNYLQSFLDYIKALFSDELPKNQGLREMVLAVEAFLADAFPGAKKPEAKKKKSLTEVFPGAKKPEAKKKKSLTEAPPKKEEKPEAKKKKSLTDAPPKKEEKPEPKKPSKAKTPKAEQEGGIESHLTEEEKATATKELGLKEWGEAAVNKFREAYADWLVTGKALTEKLAAIFKRLSDRVVALTLGASVAISPTVSESNVVFNRLPVSALVENAPAPLKLMVLNDEGPVPTVAPINPLESVPVPQPSLSAPLPRPATLAQLAVPTTPEIQTMAPVEPIAFTGVPDPSVSAPLPRPATLAQLAVPTTPEIQTVAPINPLESVPVPNPSVSPPVARAIQTSDAKPVAPAPDFGGVTDAPAEVRVTANWIMRHNDTGGRPFIIGSKVTGEMFVFDGTGKLVSRNPALYGKGRGDVVKGENKVTPSGRFPANLDNNVPVDSRGFDYKSTLDFFYNEKTDSMVAVHRVYLAIPGEDRNARIASKSPADNKISSGCVNCPDAVYDRIIRPLFKKSGGVVYILPETAEGRSTFPVDLSTALEDPAPNERKRKTRKAKPRTRKNRQRRTQSPEQVQRRGEKVTFTHYAAIGKPEGIAKIDVKWHGTGIMGGEAKRRAESPELYVPRIYIGDPGYVPEQGLNPDNKYEVTIDLGTLYHGVPHYDADQFFEDFEAFLDEHDVHPNSPERVTAFEAWIKSQGFAGIYNTDANAGYLFQSFKPGAIIPSNYPKVPKGRDAYAVPTPRQKIEGFRDIDPEFEPMLAELTAEEARDLMASLEGEGGTFGTIEIIQKYLDDDVLEEPAVGHIPMTDPEVLTVVTALRAFLELGYWTRRVAGMRVANDADAVVLNNDETVALIERVEADGDRISSATTNELLTVVTALRAFLEHSHMTRKMAVTRIAKDQDAVGLTVDETVALIERIEAVHNDVLEEPAVGYVPGLTVEENEAVSRLQQAITDEANVEGFTIDLDGNPQSGGFMVAPSKGTEWIVDKQDLTPQALWDYLEKHATMFEREGARLGGWLNPKTGAYTIDIAFPVATLEDAVRVAILAEQDAVFSLNTYQTFNTRDGSGAAAIPTTDDKGNPIPDEAKLPITLTAADPADAAKDILARPGQIGDLTAFAEASHRKLQGVRDPGTEANGPESAALRKNLTDPRQRNRRLLGRVQAFAGWVSRGKSDVEAAKLSGFRTAPRAGSLVAQGLMSTAPDADGTEHLVYLQEGDGRVLKIPKNLIMPDTFVSYLSRMIATNMLLGDDIQIVGVADKGGPAVIHTQPFIEGTKPTDRVVEAHLRKAGWTPLKNPNLPGIHYTWLSPDGRVVMSDTHAGNFVMSKDGVLRPVDVWLETIEEYTKRDNKPTSPAPSPDTPSLINFLATTTVTPKDYGFDVLEDPAVDPEDVARHTKLEEKHDKGTITPAETAEAQRLTDDAATTAGFADEGWHASRGTEEFTRFDVGERQVSDGSGKPGATISRYRPAWFSDSKEYTTRIGNLGKPTRFYLRLRKTLDLTHLGESPTQQQLDDAYASFGIVDVPHTHEGFVVMHDEPKSDTLARKVLAAGFDSMKVAERNGAISTVVWSPSQIKLAKPFTGVPLDQRFNSDSDIILEDPAIPTEEEWRETHDDGIRESEAYMEGKPPLKLVKVRDDGDLETYNIPGTHLFRTPDGDIIWATKEDGQWDMGSIYHSGVETFDEGSINNPDALQRLSDELKEIRHRLTADQVDRLIDFENTNKDANAIWDSGITASLNPLDDYRFLDVMNDFIANKGKLPKRSSDDVLEDPAIPTELDETTFSSPAHSHILRTIRATDAGGYETSVETDPLEGGRVRTIAKLFNRMMKASDRVDWRKNWRGTKRQFAPGQEKKHKADIARASGRVLEALRMAGNLFPKFQSWYATRIKMALDIFTEMDPDAALPENQFVLRVLLAVTSNGNKVKEQTEDTWKIYNSWKKTGKLAGVKARGTRSKEINNSLARVDALIAKHGWEKVRDFLNKSGTVAELRHELTTVFGVTKEAAEKLTKGELMDEQVPFALVFGAKLGSFYNNLNGNFDTTTMDRWFMRTFGRALGYQINPVDRATVQEKRDRLDAALRDARTDPASQMVLKAAGVRINATATLKTVSALSKYFEKIANRENLNPVSDNLRLATNDLYKVADGWSLVEAPENGGHRRFIRLVMEEARVIFSKETGKDWNAAELQALLWYFEKSVHDIYGSDQRDESPDYGSAANDVYRGRHNTDARAFRPSDAVRRRKLARRGVGVVDGPTDVPADALLVLEEPSFPSTEDVDRSSAVTQFHQSQSVGSDWEQTYENLVHAVIDRYPSDWQAHIDPESTSEVGFQVVGNTILINPREIGYASEGMSLQDVADKLQRAIEHEFAHRTALGATSRQDYEQVLENLDAEEREHLARQFTHHQDYQNEDVYENVVRGRIGDDQAVGPQYFRDKLATAMANDSHTLLAEIETDEDRTLVARYLRRALTDLTKSSVRGSAAIGVDLIRLERSIKELEQGEVEISDDGDDVAFDPEVSNDDDLVLEDPSPWAERQRMPIYNRRGGRNHTGYQAGGWLTAEFNLDKRVHDRLRASKQKEGAALKEAEYFAAQIERLQKKHFGSDKSKWPTQQINEALGSIDNRISRVQKNQITNLRKAGVAAARKRLSQARGVANRFDKAAAAGTGYASAATAIEARDRASFIREAARARFKADVAATRAAAKAMETQIRKDNRDRARRVRRQALAALPPDIAQAVRTMRVKIDQVGRELRRSGLISGSLAATISENSGLWLHRSYRIFDQKNWTKWVFQSNDAEAAKIRTNAARYIRVELEQEHVKKETAALMATGVTRANATATARANARAAVTDTDVENRMMDYLSVADSGATNVLQGISDPSLPLSVTMKRGIVSPAIRALWGEHKDPQVNAAKSLGAVTQFLETAKFFASVRAMGLAEGWLSTSPIAADGTRLAKLYEDRKGAFGRTSPDPRFAPLSGLYGPAALRDGLTDALSKAGGQMAWVTGLQQLTGYAMLTKTALSVQATLRNFIGNVGFIIANGHLSSWRDLPAAIKLAAQNVRGTGTRATRDIINRMVELGIFNDSAGENVIRELTNGFGSDRKAVTAFEKLVDKTLVLPLIRRGADTATRIYGAVDDVWKFVAFMSEVKRVASYRPGASQSDIEREAAQIVRDTLPTYSLAPEAVRVLRRIPFVAPFVTFTSEVIRVTMNTARIGVSQIAEGQRTGNKELVKAGMARVVGLSIIFAMIPAVLTVIARSLGFDDEDEDDLRNHIPYWEENAQLLMLESPDRDKGKIRYMNISFMNPYDVLQRPVRALLRGLKNPDAGVAEVTKDTLAQLFDPVAKEQILFGSAIDVLRGVTASGSKVYDKTDTAQAKAVKSLNHIWESALEPGTITSAKRVLSGINEEVTETGRAFDASDEIRSMVTGTKTQSVDTHATLVFAAKAFTFDRRDAASGFTKAFNGPGTVSDEELRDRYIEANEKMLRAHQKLRHRITSAIRLGTITEREARGILKDNRVGDDTINHLWNNRLPLYEPSEFSLDRARDNGRDRNQNRISLYRELRQSLPKFMTISADDDTF